jgi:plastocyanin
MRSGSVRLGVLVAAIALVAGPAQAQQTAEVTVVDSDYQPREVTVDTGGTVTWTQVGSLPHSVTADDGTFDSHPECGGTGDCMGTGDTFAHTFTEPGTYAYYCRVHGGPGGVGMSGTVVVAAAAESPDEEPTEEPTQEPTEEATPEPTDEPTDEPADDGADDGTAVTGAIEVGDQAGDGTSVTVDSVAISGADGFVVVHADQDGAPGPVLGHVAIAEGTSTDVEVPLDEPLTADATVWPMLHVDAGVAGVYEFPGADGPVMADGEVVMAPLAFTVTSAEDVASLPRTGTPSNLLLALALSAVAGGAVALRRLRPGGSGRGR